MVRSVQTARITVTNLSVVRGRRVILEDVGFSIDSGECVAIVGPNGTGKTTLMLAMLGLLPWRRGQVCLDGQAIPRFRRRQLAQMIAYVPQSYDGFSGFTVEDMVKSGRYAHRGPVAWYTPEDHRIVEEALRVGGLTDLRNRIVQTLSAGERQKVLLAAAMTQQSPIVFLDEPTTALDPKHQQELVESFRQLHRQGKTLVLICHDLNIAVALEARVLALRSGRLVFDESIGDFLHPDYLRATFDAEFEHLTAPDGRVCVFPCWQS